MKRHLKDWAWYLLVFGVGLLFASLSIASHKIRWWLIGILCVLFSAVVLLLLFFGERARSKLQAMQIARRPRVMVIGGGTGQPVLLRGLKHMDVEITAVVTVADDGGSSGRLRSEMFIPPPGDIRNCLIALADTEPLLADLLQYRFDGGTGLSGHSFGNLFLAAMTHITGDFETAIRETSRVLAVRGTVMPVAKQAFTLSAIFEDGSKVEGESQIPLVNKPIAKIEIQPATVEPVPEVIETIAGADAIVIGPGSLFTSIMPNLLVPGLVEAIRQSQAKVIFVCNVMTQPGETDGYTASDHVEAIYRHVGAGLFDMIIVNSAVLPDVVLQQYTLQNAYPVTVDVEKLHKIGLTVIARNFLQDSTYARHDPDLVAMQILALIGREHRV
jgi:uncharacterized cofD-like protein